MTTVSPHRSSVSKHDKLPPFLRFGLAGSAMLLVSLSIATFVVAAFLPLYTDEVGWKHIQGRLGFDGLESVSIYPSCSDAGLPIPALLLPFRLFETAAYQGISGPQHIRAIGVAVALGWIALAWLLLWRGLRKHASVWLPGILVVSIATLGIMPFLLVLNRPEQVLLIGMTLFAIPVLTTPPAGPRSPLADASIALLLVALGGYFFASHPRAIFALPLLLLSINHSLARKRIAVVAGVSASVLCWVALSDWSARTRCDDPGVAASFANESILSAASQGTLGTFGLHMLALWYFLPGRALYVSQMRMDQPVTSDLVPHLVTFWTQTIGVATQAVFALLVMVGAVAFVHLAVRAMRRRCITPAHLALGSLWAFYLASILTRATRHSYEQALMTPVLAMAALGSLWISREALGGVLGPARLRMLALAGVGLLAVTSVFSQAVLLVSYARYVTGEWAQPGYPAGQRFSISTADYEALQPQIIETARMCGIEPANNPRRLVVDELTWFALQPTYRPILATYIDERGWGRSISDHRKFLSLRGSEGMVVGCQWVPTQLRGEAIRNGQFCCVPSFGQ